MYNLVSEITTSILLNHSFWHGIKFICMIAQLGEARGVIESLCLVKGGCGATLICLVWRNHLIWRSFNSQICLHWIESIPGQGKFTFSNLSNSKYHFDINLHLMERKCNQFLCCSLNFKIIQLVIVNWTAINDKSTCEFQNHYFQPSNIVQE